MSENFVIRIVNPQGEDVDWTVQNFDLSFQNVLEVMSQVFPDATITAFDYEDEDGDFITVRSDEEMGTMFSHYFDLIAEYGNSGMAIQPLCVYPKVPKPAGKRNIHGLTVKTKASSAPAPQPMQAQAVNRQETDIKDILGSGQISPSDIQYLEVLGNGHSGTVYKTLHSPTNKIMAVKVIPLDITPEIQKRILSELQILYKCNFPVIIGFFGAFFAENKISICTEYMDGGSLELYGCIPEQVLGRIAVSIVKGLNYLWSLKIMHRDVKPSNILVSTKGEVKLCDFGVSAQLINSITQTYVGTNAYMAPERVLGDQYGVPSDVWSLGVSLLETTPREQELSAIDLLQCIVHENPPRLPRSHFSEQFADFVEHCMQKTPNNRPKPQMLMEHSFIRMYDDGNQQIIAQWVCGKLHEIQQRKLIEQQQMT
ncbi:dual specificity mitogen-activated protein kinase kinase 5-like isoform X2 [Ptychodera flava]|uniref:dual specificity mitogen-activated protein kinase kinase 5-like isoform X2 n=1 Tax=Ptychodera flava TaxID=63121 RepID=UPI00396A60DF